jgi:DoxX.
MKILTIIVRVLLGLGFVVFGSNAFLQFIPMPPIPQTLAGDFTRVFINSGYATVIGALQLISGLLLLIGRFVPLALTILGAIHLQHPGLSRADGAGRLPACTGFYRPRAVSGLALPGGVYDAFETVARARLALRRVRLFAFCETITREFSTRRET